MFELPVVEEDEDAVRDVVRAVGTAGGAIVEFVRDVVGGLTRDMVGVWPSMVSDVVLDLDTIQLEISLPVFGDTGIYC